jgi:hypothetical protein
VNYGTLDRAIGKLQLKFFDLETLFHDQLSNPRVVAKSNALIMPRSHEQVDYELLRKKIETKFMILLSTMILLLNSVVKHKFAKTHINDQFAGSLREWAETRSCGKGVRKMF